MTDFKAIQERDAREYDSEFLDEVQCVKDRRELINMLNELSLKLQKSELRRSRWKALSKSLTREAGRRRSDVISLCNAIHKICRSAEGGHSYEKTLINMFNALKEALDIVSRVGR